MSALSRALAMRKADPYGQFGQSNDALSNNGATGCTDTVLQFLTKFVKDQWFTHDQIRRTVGHVNPKTGLNSSEVGAWFRAKGLPYVVKFNLTADEMLSLSRTRGPLMVCEVYSHHPEWRGCTYLGATADGKPNGYARPSKAAGKNQLKGFSGRHAIVLLGYTDSNNVYVMEPNHRSPARPQSVAYDIITVAQFRVLIAAYKASNGSTYCAHPTKKLV
jgi:hypothetical protein